MGLGKAVGLEPQGSNEVHSVVGSNFGPRQEVPSSCQEPKASQEQSEASSSLKEEASQTSATSSLAVDKSAEELPSPLAGAES